MFTSPSRALAVAGAVIVAAGALSAVTPGTAYADARCTGYNASCAYSKSCKLPTVTTSCTITYVYWP